MQPAEDRALSTVRVWMHMAAVTVCFNSFLNVKDIWDFWF